MYDSRQDEHDPERRFEQLSIEQCHQYLRATSVGRVGWSGDNGPLILPVAYVLQGNVIVFRTSETGPMAELAEPQPVAFEIDAFDPSRRDAWSVSVVGQSQRAAPVSDAAEAEPDPVPWVTGNRQLRIAITMDRVTGRLLSRE
jgi:nitroimidazol reductase NimA-like FMN-containing flavoprotein (pyridoxamine 5'-phosphate oxidase superfamily)